MQKEFISKHMFVAIMILFLFGSSLVVGGTTTAKQDSWLAIILAVIISFPVMLMYARIAKLYPEMGLSDIMVELLGQVMGKIFVALIAFYSVILGGLVIRNFSEFMEAVMMPETPQLPLMILIISVTVYMAKSGMITMGRWSIFMLPFMLFIILFTIMFTVQNIDVSNLKPVNGVGFVTLFQASSQAAAFPFLESLLLFVLMRSVKRTENPYKLFSWALFIAGFAMVLVILRNTTTLGVPMMTSSYFPSYLAARLINIGDFMTRLEGSITVNFVLGGIMKITVCILAAAHTFSKLFNFKEHSDAIGPVALLMIAFAIVVYNNMMEMFDFIIIYPYFAFPFQVAIPFIVWVAAEIKTRRN